MRILIEVKDGDNGFKVVAEIGRTVRQHSGWQSVRYNGRRYQLFGGIFNREFIDISNPIKTRSESIADAERYREGLASLDAACDAAIEFAETFRR